MDEDALRSLKSARGACPPVEELVAYGELGAEDRANQPLDVHVQLCSKCQLVLMSLEEGDAASRRPELSAPADKERPSFGRWALPLAAALVLAIGGSLLYRTLTPGDPVEDTIRGSELQPIAPAGTVSGTPTFEWQSPIRAWKYHVRVFRGSQVVHQSVVWNAGAGTTRFTPPSLTLPAGEYTWQVEALDKEDVVRMTSPPQRFTQK